VSSGLGGHEDARYEKSSPEVTMSTPEAHPEPHPLNRDFAWVAPRGPFRRISAAQAEAYDRDGFFVLEDAIPPRDLERLVAEIDPREAKVERFLQNAEGGRFFIARAGEITFSTHLVKQSPWLREFCASESFRDLGHDLIGPDVRLYWDQAVYKKPGNPEDFPWHQDNGYAFVRPQQYVTCWIALTAATLENGCPWVVPGLHRRGTLRHWMTDLGWRCLEEAPGAVPLALRPGSIAVFSSLTPHRTGPNTTADVRKAYIVQLAPDGARLVGEHGEEPCAAPDRQFPILKGGRAAALEDLSAL
jgi:ectoine hydroxylase-related dioxygenase (phytanoyl-CoA dioxygenase family)